MEDSEANLVKHLMKDGRHNAEEFDIERNLGVKSRRRWREAGRLDEEHWKTIPPSVFLYYLLYLQNTNFLKNRKTLGVNKASMTYQNSTITHSFLDKHPSKPQAVPIMTYIVLFRETQYCFGTCLTN